MAHVVIFSDTSRHGNEQKFGDNINSLPIKGAGPYRIATEVRKKGFTCQVISLCFFFSLEEISIICKKFINEETLIVGFSTTFWRFNWNSGEYKEKILDQILTYTRNLKTPKIVLGGTLSAYLRDKITVDASFNGYSENEFIQYLESVANKVTYSEPDKVLPTQDYFDFNKSQIIYEPNDCIDYGESMVIEIARGCIFKCNFCAYPLNGKKKFDYIKYNEVLREEFIRNYEQYGIKTYTLSDDTFNDSTFKLEQMYAITRNLPFKISFICYARIDLLYAHREQIELLKEIGLKGVFFGIETFNTQAGKALGKGLDPEKQKELLYDLKSKYWKNDINIEIGLITGLPFETESSHQSTIDWVLNEKECIVDRVDPNPLWVPNPLLDKSSYKSKFQLEALKYGFFWPDKNSHNWKNLNFEIKSYERANQMAKEIYLAAKSRYLVFKTNFGLPIVSNVAKYSLEPKSFDDLVSMDNVSFVKWYSKNREHMINSYINNYKKQIILL